MEFHLEVYRKTNNLFLAPYLQLDVEREAKDLPTFELDERSCELKLLAARLKNPPLPAQGDWRDWVDDLVDCSRNYSMAFFPSLQGQSNLIQTKSGCSVIVQTHRKYLGGLDQAKVTLSRPLEFLHPHCVAQAPDTDSERIEWLKDIFPLKHSVETWIIGKGTSGYGDATSQYPVLPTLEFNPARTKVLLITSYAESEAAEEIKASIYDEAMSVREYYAGYFPKQLQINDIKQEEWESEDALKKRLRDVGFVFLDNPRKDQVEEIMGSLDLSTNLIVHYAGIVDYKGLKLKAAMGKPSDDTISASVLADMLDVGSVIFLYISCYHIGTPVPFLDFLIELAYGRPTILNLVSFRWSIVPKVARDVVEEIYSQSRKGAQAVWTELSERMLKVRKKLYDSYCRKRPHRQTRYYYWAAPVLIRQPVGQPRVVPREPLSNREKEDLVDRISETEKNFYDKIGKEYGELKSSPLKRRQRQRLQPDFASFIKRAREKFKELESKAQEAGYKSDKLEISGNLDEAVDQLTEELDNLVSSIKHRRDVRRL